MAAPIAVLAVKAALITAADKRTQAVIASVAAAILTPFILAVVVILSTLSGTSSHNNAAVDLAFHGGYLSSRLPADYRMYIEKMRDSFSDLYAELSEINDRTEGGEVDSYRVKAIFYSLFFGADQPRMDDEDYREFIGCFVTYEEREDEDGSTYTVAVPSADLEAVYTNLSAALGKTITAENKSNAQRIYVLAKYGQVSPGSNLPPGAAMGDGSYTSLIAEAEKYLGYPYVFGGSSPATSFDCSGFVCWVYTQSGAYHLPRTNAQGIFNQCAVVPRDEARPGDLIFFTGTYASGSPVSHIGIYVGGTQMLHCGSPIQYTSIDTNYWREHFYSFGRLLLHRDVEIEPATIMELSADTLTEAGKEAWADVLNAKVYCVYQGIYDLQAKLDGVKPSRLQSFSTMLAGYCSEENYEKWVAQPEEAPAPSPEMKL